MKNNLIITITILLISFYSHSQQPSQSVKGMIIDYTTNSPLSSANIAILNTAYETISDSLGNFNLQSIQVGRYNIKVSMMGYKTLTINEVQVTSGKEVFLNIALEENTTKLEEIVIKSNTSKEQPLNKMATVSAKMLSIEEANRYAGGFDDPARLVSSFAGISSNVGNNAIVVRGNNPQALQWKLEGVEIANPNHFADLSVFGGGGLTALSSHVLSNSDFFSGAMPSEYSNALSGVFDIYMRKGNNNKVEHTLQIGLLGIDFASEGPFRKEGKSSYLFNYRYSTLALLESLLPENSNGVKYQDLSFKLNFPTEKVGTFSIWSIGLIDRSGANAKKDINQWKYNIDKENQNVKQFMGTLGISHKLLLNDKQYIKSSIASSINGIDFKTEMLNNDLFLQQKDEVKNKAYNFVFNTFLNSKISTKHSNKTGVVFTNLNYDIFIKNNNLNQTLITNKGNSFLFSTYSNSFFKIKDKWLINTGFNTQLFTLNKKYTIEPRFGVKYQFQSKQSIGFAYGLHSRLERLNYYFVKNNKNLDFTKSHHVIISYDINLSEFIHLKTEMYYQKLFNVPVAYNNSFSLINQQNDWFFDNQLINTGKGKNYGLDITLEKYLSRGYYYMLTGSIFNSKYKGDDDIWRNTRYNRKFAFNFLIGKEWEIGKNNQNILGLNAKVSYQGGEYYSPINLLLSVSNQEVKFDESRAFSQQLNPSFTTHFTASYKINKKKSTQEIAFKIINATQYKEFTGFKFNYQTQSVDEYREAIFIPNLSWKIEF